MASPRRTGVEVQTTIIGWTRRARQIVARHGLVKAAVLGVKRLVGWVSRRLFRSSGPGVPAAAADSDFDRRFNVTIGLEPADTASLGTVASPNWVYGFKYQTMEEEAFRTILDSLAIRHEDFTFVDLGSGKGKVLFMAAEYPFRRIIGVEYSRRLHEIAQRNITTYRNPAQRCANVESVCMDATAWPIPPDPCLLFLFNPFDRPVLEAMVKNIVETFRQFPRPLFVLYGHKDHGQADVFLEHGFVEKTRWTLHGRTDFLFQPT